jgi:hypothetical protein
VRVDFSVIGASICSEIEQMQIVVHSEHRARIYSHDTSSDQLKMANVHGAIQKVGATIMCNTASPATEESQ